MNIPTVQVRGHHLIAVREEYFTPGLMTDKHTITAYGEKNASETKRLIDLILGGADVHIVSGLDDICHADCKAWREACSGKEMNDFDNNILAKYGFEVGKTYSSFEVFEKLGLNEDLE